MINNSYQLRSNDTIQFNSKLMSMKKRLNQSSLSSYHRIFFYILSYHSNYYLKIINTLLKVDTNIYLFSERLYCMNLKPMNSP